MSSLEDLKKLLLGPERDDLKDLQHRVEDASLRAEDVSEVLPRSFRLRGADPALLDSMSQPVDRCIERSVKRNPTVLAEALFPVMGPAIRRYIADALKGLVQSINQTLDHSLSARGLGWRFEAMRTGVPFGEVILRNTLAFRVEQVFLIKPETGLLIEHVADETVVERDSDAVSAMLTAIQDFVKDAFAADEPIDSVDMGDHTVWLQHGPHAYLACVIRGMPPRALRERFDEVLESIHRDFGTELRGFSGDRGPLQPVLPTLEGCLVSEVKPSGRSGGLSPAFAIVLLILLALLGWWGYELWQDRRIAQRLDAIQARLAHVLSVEPGYVPTEIRRQDTRFVVHGLRDPLARPVSQLLAEVELSPEQVDLNLRDYQDAAPAIALARARQRLQAPAEVEFRLEPPGRLLASGVARDDWRTRAELLAATVPGIQSFDGSRLATPESLLLDEVRRRLQPPAEVEIGLDDTRLTLTGVAPTEWIEAIEPRLSDLGALTEIRHDALRPAERIELDNLVERIGSLRVFFADGVQVEANQTDTLAELVDSIQRLLTLGELLRLHPVVWVSGQTDGIGDPAGNARLSYERARVVVERLASAVPQADLRARARTSAGHNRQIDFSLRRVDFEVDLQTAAAR